MFITYVCIYVDASTKAKASRILIEVEARKYVGL